MKKWIIPALAFFASATANANEGMWQPHQLADIKESLIAAGIKLNPDDMSDLNKFPMNAIVSLGGCSASFVSPKGLVVTNHHCAYRSIQHNSSEKNNLLANGFVANTLQAELPAAPGSRVYVTESLSDVSAEVVGDISPALDGQAYYAAVEKKEKDLVAACETSPDYRCNVVSFHGGASYFLIKQMMIKDVRLAYAPASSIGKFGGDTDNWMWPRHTGDWAFYRAYVGKDGKPADYSEENIPYTPKSFLKVNASGVDNDDFVMVLGYPGRTNRYRTALEVQDSFTWSYPTAKRYREEYIAVIEANSAANSDERIKYKSTIAGLANYAKNYGSMIESYAKGNMLERKQELEADLAQWLATNPEMNSKYGASSQRLQSLLDTQQQGKEIDLLMSYMSRTSMWGLSTFLVRHAHEMQKADADREPGYQKRDEDRAKQYMASIDSRYVANIDKAIFAHFLQEYVNFDKTQRNPVFDEFMQIKDGDASQALAKLDAMYANTTLGDLETRLAMLDMSEAELLKSQDPFIQFAVFQFDHNMKQEQKDKELSGELQKTRPDYMKALIAFKQHKGEQVYADANSTLRITYGNVKGYSPQDGLVAVPFTTPEGMLRKYVAGDDEFDLPAPLRAAIEARNYGDYQDEKLGSIAVNYLSTLDITGGNSGSPTLNAKGEFVGLVFDGVYESIIGDWDYDPTYNRAIHVSSPYMLWVMDEIDGADALLKEMTVVRD